MLSVVVVVLPLLRITSFPDRRIVNLTSGLGYVQRKRVTRTRFLQQQRPPSL